MALHPLLEPDQPHWPWGALGQKPNGPRCQCYDQGVTSETPERAPVVVGTFNLAQVFPPTDPMTVPLLRLMLGTDDVRHASMLFVMADHQVRETTGTQQALHGGQMWYVFRLLCSHLRESGNAVTTFVNSVADRRLQDLLRERPAASAALERLRRAFGPDAFITKVRDSIGSHYPTRIFHRRMEGLVENR